MFVEAPLILGICSIPEKCWSRRDGKSYSDVDAAIVMDHIILTATDLGLGTCWIGAFDSQAARDILELDPSWEPIAFTPIGYAKETTFKKTRKPIEDIVVFINNLAKSQYRNEQLHLKSYLIKPVGNKYILIFKKFKIPR